MGDLEIRTYTTYSIYDSDGEFISGPFETQEALDAELKRLAPQAAPPAQGHTRACASGEIDSECPCEGIPDWDGMPGR